MTTALCLRCGATKLGAFCACATCGGSAGADRSLAIALSSHVLPVTVLERLGRLIADLGARATDGEARHAAFLLFLREHMPPQFHRDIAHEDRARALLAEVELPDVRIVSPVSGPRPLPLPHASQRRALFWEQVMAEVRRNPALSIRGEAPIADAPDLVVVDLACADVRVLHDASVEVTPGDEAALERRRARHVASQIETRRRDLEAIGAFFARAQRVYLEGERPTPVHVPFEDLVGALPPELPRRRIAAHVADGWLEHDGQRFALARLVERAPAEVGFRRVTAATRSPAQGLARR